MIINLNDDYRLHSMPMNIVIERKITPDKGKNVGVEYWREDGYYPNIESALNGVFKRLIETTEAKGVQNIINMVQTAVHDIAQKISILQEDSKEIEQDDEVEEDEGEEAYKEHLDIYG